MQGNADTQDSPKVAIIILNWNGAQDTIECIDSLLGLTYPDFRVIVVDNASPEDDVQMLRKRYGTKIDIIRNEKNEGYAEGNNIGIRFARQRYHPEFVWILNNDTAVERNTLDLLVGGALRDNLDIIGATVRNYGSDTIYCLGGGVINFWTGIDRLWGARKPSRTPIRPTRFSYIAGCSMLIKAKMFDTAGYFDPNYFLYSEEADFCTRVMKQGGRLGYVPEAVVHHKPSRSTGHLSPSYVYYFLRNKLLFMKKNARWWNWITFAPVWIFAYCVGFGWAYWRKNHRSGARIILQSATDFMRGRFGAQFIRRG